MSSSLLRRVLQQCNLKTDPKAASRRRKKRRHLLQQLEPRVVLNAAPVAAPDPYYETASGTTLSVGTSDTTLLDNDWDAEGDSLSTSKVTDPVSGTLSAFGTDGTFTYVPNSGFSGLDSFTYKVSDGTSDSHVVAVSIAVGGDIGVKTNGEDTAITGMLGAGSLQITQPVLPGVSLIYQSNTQPLPIVAVDTTLKSGSTVPDDLDAQLTFNGTSGSTYGYSTSGLSAGDDFRIAQQYSGSSLATGRYDYSLDVTANYPYWSTTHTFEGTQNVVNRGASSHPFGSGWQLAGLDELHVDTGGALWVHDTGEAFWFEADGSGGYLAAEGDLTFSTLVKNTGGDYTLTTKAGTELDFDSNGIMTSIADRSGNTISYTYTSGLLTKITDPFSRDTTLTYTSGQLTGITDFASRSATLSYTSGLLTSVEQPDPDGAGALIAPETTFAYDALTDRMTKLTDALSEETDFTYGTHGRLSTITHPDTNTFTVTPLQTIGMPTGSSGNTLAAANPLGTQTDERGNDSTYRLDRFGNVIEWNDQLSHQTLSERNADGQLVRLTEADPDGAGSLTSPVTLFGYDIDGNLVYRENPDATTNTWTYTTAFHQVDTATDELSREVSFDYDTNGNLTGETDGEGYETTHTYDSQGLRTSTTTPDPDGAGSLTAATTNFIYDTNGRLTEIEHPDTETRTFAYDTADNLTSVTDELGYSTTFAYDNLARMTSTTDRESGTVSLVYDALGQLTKQTDALGNATDFEYNARGWRTKVTQPDPDGAGPLSAPVSEMTYDATGNFLSLKTPFYGTDNGQPQTVSHGFDAAGRKTKTAGPLTGTHTDFSYDAIGRLTSTAEYQRLQTTYEYDSRGRVTEMAWDDGYDPTPPTTTYDYDAAGQLISTTDPRGYTTSYEFDDRGLLKSETLPDPDGSGSMLAQSRSFTYDNVGRLTREWGIFTRVTQYEYDARDRVTKIKLPDPLDLNAGTIPELSFTYDAASNLATETDPLGNVTTYTFDKEGRVKTVTAPDPDGTGSLTSPVTSYVYDAAGQTTSITDPRGGVTAFEYDTHGRQTKLTLPDPDGAGSLTAPVTTYEFNASGSHAKITDPAGRETTFTYDSINRRTGISDDSGNSTTYAYDNFDNITKITGTDPDGAGSLTAPETDYTYDLFDRVTRVTDPENGYTDTTYDDAGNILTINDPAGNETSYAYDGMGRTTIETNELGKSRSYEYELAGNLARYTDRNGRVIQYTHDNLERLYKERWYSSATPTPSLSVAETTKGGVFDEVQRVGYSGYISGGSFTLSLSGQTTGSLSNTASAAQVQSALESLSTVGSGNVSVTKQVDGGTNTTEWVLSFQGTLAETNVAQTDIVTTFFGGTWTDIEATDTAGGSYDEVQTVTLANSSGGTLRLAFAGETTAALDYDATAAEVKTALEALNAVDQVTVTGSAGGPWTVTLAGTHVSTDVAAIMGDATAATNGTLERTITSTFDKASQLTGITDTDSSYAYAYDNLGRLLTSDNDGTSGVPRVILTSVYDAGSNRTGLSATIDGTDDFENSYTYDQLNRLTRVDQIGVTGGNTVSEKRVDFSYKVDGRFETIARYNDIAGGSGDEIATSTYSYDTLGRLTGLDYEQGGTDLFTPYVWTYDDLSRITQFTSADGTSNYTYDQTDQLTDATHSYQTDESYSYDANGNRTNTGYTTGDDNRLTNDGTFSYTYDDEGNRTKRTHDTSSEETLYEWDFRNRLTKVTEKDGTGTTTKVVEYTYDVFDRRIGKEVDSSSPFDMADAVIERYVYDDLSGVNSVDGGNVVLDFVDPDGTGTTSIALEKRRLFGNVVDQILAEEDVTVATSSADRVYWPLVDHLGTVRDLVKNDGTLGEHYEYDAFGNVTSGNTALTRYLYTSREHDADTGLQYNRARWYDAAVGRWISQDPIGFAAGDANLYRYVGNAAISTLDPSGLQTTGPPESDLFDDQEPLNDDEAANAVEKAIKKAAKDKAKQIVIEAAENHGALKTLQELGDLLKIPLGSKGSNEDTQRNSSVPFQSRIRRRQLADIDIKFKPKVSSIRNWTTNLGIQIYVLPPRPPRRPPMAPDPLPQPPQPPITSDPPPPLAPYHFEFNIPEYTMVFLDDGTTILFVDGIAKQVTFPSGQTVELDTGSMSDEGMLHD